MIADEPAYHEPQTSIARAALSTTPAAPPHDPTMPRGVVAGPTGAASSHRAHNHADSVPGVPTCLVEADERRYDAVAPSSSAPSFEYRRGYERAVKDAVEAAGLELHVRGMMVPVSDASKMVEDAIRSLLPATEREGTEAEVERIAIAISDSWDATDDEYEGTSPLGWEKSNGAWKQRMREIASAVLAAMGRGK